MREGDHRWTVEEDVVSFYCGRYETHFLGVSEADLAAAKRAEDFHNDMFFGPLFKGAYPTDLIEAYEPIMPRIEEGDLKGDVTIPRPLISSLIRRELVVLGTWNSKIAPAGRSEWDMVVRHVADGSLQVAPLISHTPTLDEVPAVLADMAARRIWSNKVVFAVADEARQEVQA